MSPPLSAYLAAQLSRWFHIKFFDIVSCVTQTNA
jgi:hypothetical protein